MSTTDARFVICGVRTAARPEPRPGDILEREVVASTDSRGSFFSSTIWYTVLREDGTIERFNGEPPYPHSPPLFSIDGSKLTIKAPIEIDLLEVHEKNFRRDGLFDLAVMIQRARENLGSGAPRCTWADRGVGQ